MNKTILELVSSEFHSIPTKEYLNIISSLMKKKEDFSEALKYVINTNKEQYFNFFLDNKINVNYKNGDFLATAIVSENMDFIKKLVEKGAVLDSLYPDFKRPLSYAISTKNKDIVEYLIKKGASVLSSDLLASDNLDILDILESSLDKENKLDKDNPVYINQSTLRDSYEKTKHLLEKGFAFNKESFENAVESKKNQTMELLIDNNVDVSNMAIIKLNIAQNFMILKLLLDQDKIDPKKCLHFSMMTENKDVVEFLIKDKKTEFDKEVTFMDVLDNGDLKGFIESLLHKKSKDDSFISKIIEKEKKKDRKSA